MADSPNIDSLIKLLDDPDENIFVHIRNEIMLMGPDVIPNLEEVWEEGSLGLLFQTRIEEIIHDIQFNSVKKELNDWQKNDSENLLRGVYLIAKYQYPELEFEEIDKTINQITQDIWIELNENLTALEKTRIINHIVFDVYGFTGNTSNYHAPQNSYINNVLESKKGNPISLSILFIVIGDKLGLPIEGINLPRHFITGWVDDFFFPHITDEPTLLFYINPFSKGTVFSQKDIEYFLKQINIEAQESFFKPCDNIAIMNRVLNNLIRSYSQQGYAEKVDELMILQRVINPES